MIETNDKPLWDGTLKGIFWEDSMDKSWAKSNLFGKILMVLFTPLAPLRFLMFLVILAGCCVGIVPFLVIEWAFKHLTTKREYWKDIEPL